MIVLFMYCNLRHYELWLTWYCLLLKILVNEQFSRVNWYISNNKWNKCFMKVPLHLNNTVFSLNWRDIRLWGLLSSTKTVKYWNYPQFYKKYDTFWTFRMKMVYLKGMYLLKIVSFVSYASLWTNQFFRCDKLLLGVSFFSSLHPQHQENWYNWHNKQKIDVRYFHVNIITSLVTC